MKLDNASRWGTLFAALLGINLLVACGGGGGGGDGSSGPPNTPPQNVPAPDTIGGNTFTFFFGVEGTRAVTFNEDNVTWVETRDGAPFMGTYRYNRIENGNRADLVLIEDSVETPISLTFNAANSGAFAFGDQSRSGTFETRSNDPDPNEPPPNNGLAPSSLAGRTMLGTRTFTTTGPVGQTHVYTFSVNSFHDSDPPEESDGGYIYQPSGNNAVLTLNYFSPASFNGDQHEIQLTFHTTDAGVFESIYTRAEGTVIRINGTFELE